MKKHLVISITGPDQLGIVDRVTKTILECSGNIDESKMARLGGEFSMILLVSVHEDCISKLSASLEKLQDEQFFILIRETSNSSAGRFNGWVPYQITVSGADHEGIINSITHHLAGKGISVETADTNTSAAPMSGTLLFTMDAVVLVPPTLHYQGWREPLNKIGEKMNVSVEVYPYRG